MLNNLLFYQNNFFVKEQNLFLNQYVSTEQNAIIVLFLFSLFCGSCILFCKNPIFSLIFLILTFTSIIMIFLILHIEFLALTFLIIYIGAIAILFLFVIMMFNLKQLQLTQTSSELFYLVVTTYFFIPKFFIVLLEAVEYLTFSAAFNPILFLSKKTAFICNYENLLYILKYKNNDILLLSDFLYTDYGYLFILTGMMLLSSMFGSIVLAMLSQNKLMNKVLYLLLNSIILLYWQTFFLSQIFGTLVVMFLFYFLKAV